MSFWVIVHSEQGCVCRPRQKSLGKMAAEREFLLYWDLKCAAVNKI